MAHHKGHPRCQALAKRIASMKSAAQNDTLQQLADHATPISATTTSAAPTSAEAVVKPLSISSAEAAFDGPTATAFADHDAALQLPFGDTTSVEPQKNKIKNKTNKKHIGGAP